jgi:hypothetical protein
MRKRAALLGLVGGIWLAVPAAAQWVADASKAAVPNRPAAGKIHGKPFRAARVELDYSPGDKDSARNTYFLKLRQGGDFFADYEYSFTLITPKAQSISGKRFIVDSRGVFEMGGAIKEKGVSYPPVQGVSMTWKVPDKTFGDTDMMSKYTMRLEFGVQKGSKVPGRVYLAMQDAHKSFVCGTFTAVVKKLGR